MVKEGWNALTDVNVDLIIDAIENFNPKKKAPRKSFGGDAATKMAKIIKKNLDEYLI